MVLYLRDAGRGIRPEDEAEESAVDDDGSRLRASSWCVVTAVAVAPETWMLLIVMESYGKPVIPRL